MRPGNVVLQLSATRATSGRPGLSLRLETRELAALMARLTARQLAFRRDAVGL